MNSSCQNEIKPILMVIDEINDFLIRSEFDLDAVLDIIINKALELSQGKYGQILLYNGQDLIISATTGVVEKGVRLKPSECACGIVVESKKPLILDDVEKAPRYFRFFGDARSELAVPLMKKDKLLGVINIESPKPAAFTDHHKDLLATLALKAAYAIKIAIMYEQQKALAEIDRTLASASKDPPEVFELIIRKSLNLIGGRSGQLLLRENDELVIAATTGEEKPMVTRVPLESCVSGVAVRDKKPINVGDVTRDHPYNTLYKSYLGDMRSELVIPLIEKDEVIGVLNFENPIPDFFDDEHIRILTHMADHATIAIRNMQIYQRFREGMSEVKRLLSELEEFPDKMKRALGSFHKITQFFEERDHEPVHFLFPPTGDY